MKPAFQSHKSRRSPQRENTVFRVEDLSHQNQGLIKVSRSIKTSSKIKTGVGYGIQKLEL